MDPTVCASCSETICSQVEHLNICKKCSSDLINHLFSPARYSALNSILPLNNETYECQDRVRRKVMHYNELCGSRNAFDKKESRLKESFIREFYNISEPYQNAEFPYLVVWNQKNLFQFLLDDLQNKKLPNYRNFEVGRVLSHSLVDNFNGFVMICIFGAGEIGRFYLFHRDLSLDLVFFGDCPFRGKGILSLSGDRVYCFNENDFNFKYNFATNRWEQLLAYYYGMRDLNTIGVGSKILITGSNRKSLLIYDTLGDYFNEFEDIFEDDKYKKILLFDGNRVIYILKDYIKITDLRFIRHNIEIRRSLDIKDLVSPPVFYKNNFYMVSNEFIYRFNVDNHDIQKFILKDYTFGCDYIQCLR